MDLLSTLVSLVWRILGQVVASIDHNWPFLLGGIAAAAAVKVYIGSERIAVLFRAQTPLAVGGSVAAAVTTPFCSCGTTAVILSMLASAVPWAPIVAFMVASPLTSPGELVLSAGLFGWPFALLFFAGSIALGLAGGAAAHVAERAGWLADQARFGQRACESATCSAGASIGPGAASVAEFARPTDPWRLRALATETLALGRGMAVLFVGFSAIGYTVIALVPTAWMATLLGGSDPLSVVLAATLGLPFYMSTDANLPLLASLMAGGVGAGPAMAFLVTGAGTSIGALSGALLIARWRVLAIVVGTLWVGAVVLGLVTSAAL